MKYPKSFTLVDRMGGHDVEATYDDVKKAYMLDYGNGKPITFAESEITRLLDWYYDIVPTYPDSLSFYHDTTTQQYDLVKIPHINKWACYQDGSTHGATYTAEEIAGHFAKGHWREVSFAEAQDDPEERKMVFPFTFYVGTPAAAYEAVGMNIDGTVQINAAGKYCTKYCVTEVQSFIKDAIWIVTSVGPQKPTEPPTSASKPLVVSVQSEQLALATERANELAEALVAVRVCLEDFQAAVKNFDVDVEVA